MLTTFMCSCSLLRPASPCATSSSQGKRSSTSQLVLARDFWTKSCPATCPGPLRHRVSRTPGTHLDPPWTRPVACSQRPSGCEDLHRFWPCRPVPSADGSNMRVMLVAIGSFTPPLPRPCSEVGAVAKVQCREPERAVECCPAKYSSERARPQRHTYDPTRTPWRVLPETRISPRVTAARCRQALPERRREAEVRRVASVLRTCRKGGDLVNLHLRSLLHITYELVCR